jgi:hypothetical protein
MMPTPSGESDGFAIAMIVVMGCAFGMIALMIFGIIRSARKRNREVDDLLDEISSPPPKKPAIATPPEKKPESWEREGDWWKR